MKQKPFVMPFSVEEIPNTNASVAFTGQLKVYKESTDDKPQKIAEGYEYMRWGADNEMPYQIIDIIESDETLSTCQMFNAEVCYGSGLQYNTDSCNAQVKSDIDRFCRLTPLASYYLGVCQDFNHFGFCVSVLVLSKDRKSISSISRLEAAYCRFAPQSKQGAIPYLLYANWRKNFSDTKEIQKIFCVNPENPWDDLQDLIKSKPNVNRFAVVSRIPTPDSTYYPIPYYASLFKGKWYNIKQLIGMGKEAMLKNAAPLKYTIEISDKYWDRLFRSKGITDLAEKQKEVKARKDEMRDFLSGVENSGKVLFSGFYVDPNGKENHEIVINRIDNQKQGGEWSTDIQEAVNMFCFTMRVHSNLVGSVPGKSQSNNSGSDKRELYTIAQALKKPYHDLMFLPHYLLIEYNKWNGAYPECPFIQLTTLDEHTDAKQVNTEKQGEEK